MKMTHRPVAHDATDVVGDGAIDAVNAETAQQHETVKHRQLLVLFGILHRLRSVGVVPALPLVLVQREVVEQRSELVGELLRQQRHVLPALVGQPGERLGTLGRLQ